MNKPSDESITVVSLITSISAEICDKYCKYPCMPAPEGKTDDWLYEDDGPCVSCPINKLG